MQSIKSMAAKFNQDKYPGKPKILFIGWPVSTHTHSWIDLLENSDFNVRLFSLPEGLPPDNWKVKTYVTVETISKLDSQTRTAIYPPQVFPFFRLRRLNKWLYKIAKRFQLKQAEIEKQLAQVIQSWNPDIIHTLGLDPASYFYLRTREQFKLAGIGKWVAQVRGGPDLALHRFLPDYLGKMKQVFAECDQLIADNQCNYDYAVHLGLAKHKLASLGVVPGTGGMDVTDLEGKWSKLPSQRERLIVWPKTYEAPSSKALPVFEALKMAWKKIKPCQIEMLWVVQSEIEMWFQTLPEEIRASCHIQGRIPRDNVLDLFSQARVMLAPSLTDGVPNSMLEAMALGAFPIVSPLETIIPVVKEPENVLFARNLYPHELAAALERAMTDDSLVDSAAVTNLDLVGRVANRTEIAPRVIEYYKDLAFDN